MDAIKPCGSFSSGNKQNSSTRRVCGAVTALSLSFSFDLSHSLSFCLPAFRFLSLPITVSFFLILYIHFCKLSLYLGISFTASVTSSIWTLSPALSGASKETSSTILSLTVCSRLAPIFSTVLFVYSEKERERGRVLKKMEGES